MIHLSMILFDRAVKVNKFDKKQFMIYNQYTLFTLFGDYES